MNTLGFAHTFPNHQTPPSSGPISGTIETTRHSIPEGYQIIECLGRGGCAAVYEARHAEHGHVAIKISEVARANAGEADKRLEREALLAQRVSHPNVLQVFDLGYMDDGSPFIVMERLRGEDLECLLQRVGPLPVVVACELVLETLRGLEAVHDADIVHRDLKPNNVILHTPDDWSNPIVKLIDFGVARGAGAEKLTRTGTVIGTPQYLAPEQAKGQKVDARADVWAMGILFYELLLGEGPFEGANLQETLAAILFADVESVHARRPEVPVAISAVIEKALRREADERFATAREMRQALERAIISLGLVVSPGTLFAVSVLPKRADPSAHHVSLSSADTLSGVRVRPVIDTSSTVDFEDQNTRRRNALGAMLGLALVLILAFGLSIGLGSSDAQSESSASPRADASAAVSELSAPMPVPSALSAAQGNQSGAAVAIDGAGGGVVAPLVTTVRAPRTVRPVAAGLSPDQRRARTLIARGRVSLARGRVDEAYAIFDEATDADPESADAWRGYGLAAYQKGNMGEARRAMRRYRVLSSQP